MVISCQTWEPCSIIDKQSGGYWKWDLTHQGFQDQGCHSQWRLSTNDEHIYISAKPETGSSRTVATSYCLFFIPPLLLLLSDDFLQSTRHLPEKKSKTDCSDQLSHSDSNMAMSNEGKSYSILLICCSITQVIYVKHTDWIIYKNYGNSLVDRFNPTLECGSAE